MREQSCSVLLTSPNYARMLLRLGFLNAGNLPELVDIVLGTAPVSPELVGQLLDAFPAARVHLRYGLSEAVGTLVRGSVGAKEATMVAGDVGFALPGVRARGARW